MAAVAQRTGADADLLSLADREIHRLRRYQQAEPALRIGQRAPHMVHDDKLGDVFLVRDFPRPINVALAGPRI